MTSDSTGSMSCRPDRVELIRPETVIGIYAAVDRLGRIEVQIDGTKLDTFEDLETAVAEYPDLI